MFKLALTLNPFVEAVATKMKVSRTAALVAIIVCEILDLAVLAGIAYLMVR
jgi:hypothetical protein